MASIIRKGRIENGNWPRLDEAALRALLASTGGMRPDLGGPVRGVLVPLHVWRAHEELCAALGVEIGILLREDDDLAEIAARSSHIGLIAVNFAQFTNGRGYSIARLLRGRYGYRGELRAIGEVLRDQLFYLGRVGFDAFELRDEQDAEAALRAFSDFSVAYQASSDAPSPLFRRRAA